MPVRATVEQVMKGIGLVYPSDIRLRVGNLVLTIPACEPHAFYATFIAREWDRLGLRRGDRVLDAGANVGDFSIKAADEVGPEGLVVAIEPSRTACEYLQHNIAQNRLSNVRVVHGYLTSQSGQRYYQETGSYAAPKSTSITQGPAYLVNGFTKDQLLRTFGLSAFDAIKMDIEGAELDVFSDPSLLSDIRSVAVETHSPEADLAVVETLKSHSFAVGSYTIPWFVANLMMSTIEHPAALFRAEVRTNGTALRGIAAALGHRSPVPSLSEQSGLRIRYGSR